jgi:sugar phosphate isomerase/epimerase
MKRRDFVQTSIASAGLSTISFKNSQTKTTMKAIGLATNWGWTGTLDAFAAKAKELGYDGFETWFPNEKKDQDELLQVLEKYKLQVGFLIGGSGPDFQKHLQDFKNALDGAVKFKQKPLYINCHSGKDFFSLEQNSKFIEFTIEQADKTGIKIAHETHRGRLCFAAHVTKAFLEKYPKMRLTLDISHWTNVHESLLGDQTDAVNLALSRTVHLHTRVGHEEGPQVNDPRAPEWKDTLKAHLGWWDTVIKNLEKAGEKQFTFLTEFGPPSYLPTLPYTNVPVADQWDINIHMLKFIKARYAQA